MTDYVVNNENDLAGIIGATAGKTAWVKNALELFVLSDTGGDWVCVGQAGKKLVGVASVAQLANGASASVSINFPAGMFTQPPVLVVTPKTNRYTVGVLSVSATGATIRVSNWSGANSSDGTTDLYWQAEQLY